MYSTKKIQANKYLGNVLIFAFYFTILLPLNITGSPFSSESVCPECMHNIIFTTCVSIKFTYMTFSVFLLVPP